MHRSHRDDIVKSYYRHRRSLGVLGVALPVLILLGTLIGIVPLEPSLSHYYHTPFRDIFIGLMVAIGLFLLSYEGYAKTEEEWVSDRFLAITAGMGALVLALFPTTTETMDEQILVYRFVAPYVASVIHYVATAIFAFALMAICLTKFTRTHSPQRRLVYRICGVLMGFGILSVAAGFFLTLTGGPRLVAWIEYTHMVFWSELIVIWSFGVSWFLKGHVERLMFWPSATRRRVQGE